MKSYVFSQWFSIYYMGLSVQISLFIVICNLHLTNASLLFQSEYDFYCFRCVIWILTPCFKMLSFKQSCH